MKYLLTAALILATMFTQAAETCVTSEFGGITTTRCKENGVITSVCKSREFAGKIYTECR